MSVVEWFLFGVGFIVMISGLDWKDKSLGVLMMLLPLYFNYWR